MNFLMLLMLTINPATQSDSLFVASDSLFDSHALSCLGINIYHCTTQQLKLIK